TWGRSTTLYFDEIAALREAIHLHDYQLRQLSAAELQAAVDQVRRNVRAAGGREIAAPSQSLPVPSQHPLL
ncbi:MAG TPA: hypothetical protein VLI06_11110, partial [Solimonas sp.]|nr:hypothetical protein [Solimonas sp.]